MLKNLVLGSVMSDCASGKKSQEQSTKRPKPDSKSEGGSTSSSSSKNEVDKNTVPVGEKKAGSSRLKKLKTYFCFATF